MAKKKTIKKPIIIPILITIIILLGSLEGIYYCINNLKYGLDLQGGFEVLYEVNSIDGSDVTSEMVNNTRKIIEKRINTLGVSEPEISQEGNNIRVQMAGVKDNTEAKKMISTTAALTFRTVDGQLLMDSTVLNSGKASVGYDTSKGYYISLSVKDYDKFYKATKKVSEMKDNYIVIWLDYEEGTELVQGTNKEGQTAQGYYQEDQETGANTFHACGDLNDSNCLSYAGVSQGFASDVIIQGYFTKSEAQGLVDLINSGSMPTKLKEISSKTVSASFGENSLEKTFLAGVVGICLIALLLIFIYKLSGFIASASILAYTFLTLLIFNLVGGRLTLQGIAALVIGIGMAVDSAVILFSRVKEKLREGLNLKNAYNEGSKDSFISILDANVTTLIAAIILFILGESSVKGFATMLIISIIVTFIVMVYLNRFILKEYVNTEKFNKHRWLFMGYRKNKKENKFNFVKHKNIIFVLVSLIVLVGCIFTYSEGLNLGIDFKGGSSIEINSSKKIKIEEIQKDLKELNYKVESIEKIDSKTVYITISNVLNNTKTEKVEKYFNDKYNATTSVGAISNQVKKDLTRNAVKALIIACIGMVIYVSIRFKFSYGISAIIALIHDSLMVLIVFSFARFEVNSMFIAAILSIIGYSINDTIVIFDRVRENKKKLYGDRIGKYENLEDIVNTSLRSSLGRCIVTTTTTMLPVISLIVLGSHEILNFNIALLIGLLVGTFSSLFISSQIWMSIEKRKIGKDPNKHWYDDDKKKKKEPEELRVKGVNC